MSRPAQLERQIERVKELQAELLEGNEPVQPDNDPGTTPTEPITQPVVNEPPVTISKEEYDKLEQRYRTLQGMHTADVQRYRAEQASLSAAIQDLEDRLVAAEKAKATPATAPKYVTEKDVEEYGDTLEMVRRAAREEAENIAIQREIELREHIAQLEARLGYVQNTVVPKVEDLSNAQINQVKASFWGEINTQVPDWRTVNDDPNFKAWLLAEDPVTGATRQQFLRQAQNDLNAPRVIRFFNEWKRSQAGGQTPAPTNATQTDLEKLVAPGASKGGGNPATPEKKQWTGADIAQFYKDVATGKYAGRPDERRKIEADIFLAQKESRVS